MTNQTELIPMMPGDILRYEREKKGHTLETAAQLSKIKMSVLSAIETGETGEIPSVYLRGFIRNYARFLGVNPDRLDQHMHLVRGAEPEMRSVFQPNPQRRGADRWLKATSYFAASALIATLAWQFTHEAVRFSQGDSNLRSGTSVPDQAAGANGLSESAPAHASNKHLSASIASMEMLNPHENSSNKSTAEEAWDAVQTQDKAALKAAGIESSVVPQAIQVTTSADTWVEIFDADGLQIEMDLIRADESRSYTGTAPFSVLVGRASAVQLRFDGQPVDLAPHTRGNVARMTLGGQTIAETGQQADTIQR